MKTKILYIAILLLSFSCSNNSNLDMDDDGSNNSQSENFVSHTVDGIEFKFCLLNRDSVPATTFKEGELFNWYLEVKNTNLEKQKILDLLFGSPCMYDEGKVHFYQFGGVPVIYRMPHEIDLLAGETVVHYGPCNLIISEGKSEPASIIPVGNYTFEFQIDLAFILKEGTLSFILPVSVQ